jgi:hypothetical protein
MLKNKNRNEERDRCEKEKMEKYEITHRVHTPDDSLMSCTALE